MKCPLCNLVNFTNARSCKKCGNPLPSTAQSAHPVGNIGASEKCLVLRSPYSFPNRCLKCNQPTEGDHQNTELKYYPKYNVLTLLRGTLYWKKIKLKIPLCRRHKGARTNISMILAILLVTGVIALAIGLFTLNPILILFGGLLIGVSVFADIKLTPLIIVKMNGDRMWIKGVGQEFLSTLPVISN